MRLCTGLVMNGFEDGLKFNGSGKERKRWWCDVFAVCFCCEDLSPLNLKMDPEVLFVLD